MSMPGSIRPNGDPPGIVKKRVSKNSRRRIKVVTNQVPNLHLSAASSRKMLTPREQGDFGNQSWNRIVKLLDPLRVDYLFVLVGDGRRWFIPSDRVGGGTGLRLGGPKYADFEVESGDPIPGCTVDVAASTIAP